MPTEIDKWVQAVTKLTELTQAGTLTWTVGPHPNTFGEVGAGPAFYSEHAGQKMRLRPVRPLVAVLISREPMVKLELLDDDNDVLWAFPEISAISDLYNAAQYQASGLNRFIDGLIGGEQGQ